ncbi:hypothetical protein [Clostridium fessum]
MITFNTKGLDFALTALFVMIFTEQWIGQKRHWPVGTVFYMILVQMVFV